jgi:hypothetical protein
LYLADASATAFPPAVGLKEIGVVFAPQPKITDGVAVAFWVAQPPNLSLLVGLK